MQIFIYLASFLLGLFIFAVMLIWLKEFIIRRSRDGDNRGDFVEGFVKEGISETLVIDVYQYLQNWMSFKDFPVRAQDNLGVIYGIVDEDLDDLIKEIAEANNLKVPVSVDYWQPVITVKDLIRFTASFPGK